MGHAGWLVLAVGWVVHRAGFQMPHYQEIQCLDCQVQPHGMLQKTALPSCVNSASQISVWTKPACVQCCSGVGRQCSQAVTCSQQPAGYSSVLHQQQL